MHEVEDNQKCLADGNRYGGDSVQVAAKIDKRHSSGE